MKVSKVIPLFLLSFSGCLDLPGYDHGVYGQSEQQRPFFSPREQEALAECITDQPLPGQAWKRNNACLNFVFWGGVTKIRHVIFAASSLASRIQVIEERAHQGAWALTLACAAPQPKKEGDCPPHALRPEPLRWPNGNPWAMYFALGKDEYGKEKYEVCYQYLCNKCETTIRANCRSILVGELPANIYEQLVTFGDPVAE